MRGRNKPLDQLKIAKERINILFDEAEKAAKDRKFGYANRYLYLARKIGMRYNVRIPNELRRKFCRRCKKYLYPESSCKITETKGFIKVGCLNCGKLMSYKVSSYRLI